MSKRLKGLLVVTLAVGGVVAATFLWVPAGSQKRPKFPLPHAGADNRVEVRVTAEAFEPPEVAVTAGKPVTLVVTRVSDQSCATELVIPGLTAKVPLPLNTPVSVTFLPPNSGRLRYGCGMGMMMSAVLVVE